MGGGGCRQAIKYHIKYDLIYTINIKTLHIIHQRHSVPNSDHHYTDCLIVFLKLDFLVYVDFLKVPGQIGQVQFLRSSLNWLVVFTSSTRTWLYEKNCHNNYYLLNKYAWLGQNEIIVCLELPPALWRYPIADKKFISKKWRTFFIWNFFLLIFKYSETSSLKNNKKSLPLSWV